MMIDMRAWRSGSVEVLDGVDLDPRNVRLDIPAGAPQPDVIADLFKNEKALDLVEGIVKVGYLTHEVPIVVERDGRLVVAEGNRRLAALKSIQNPYLVPEFQARVSALVANMTQADRDALRIVEVKYAPSQSAADELIAALHTSNPRVPWSPTRQAAFFQAQIDAGRTLLQLRTSYPTVAVEKYVWRSAILRKFQSVKYSSPVLSDYVRSRGFSISTLARIYEAKEFIDFAGLVLDAQGTLKCKLSANQFAAVAEIIAAGMRAEDITTRSVNSVKSPRFRALMDELKVVVGANSAPTSNVSPPGSGATAGTTARGGASGTGSAGGAGSASGTSAGGTASGQGSGSAGKPATKTKKPPTLDVASIIVPAGFPPAIERIFGELSTIYVDRYPNAVLDLLRTTLEKTIKAFAEIQNVDIRQQGKNVQGYVYLKNCLDWLQDWIQTNGPKAQLQVVQKLQGAKINTVGYATSKSHLDAINHNHHIFATGDEVRDAWDAMQSLFTQVMFK
jgi:uncharacterized membrane protein YgcG